MPASRSGSHGAYSVISEPEARCYDVEHGERHQPAPSIVHKLVIAEAGQRAAHPNVKKQETENFEYKPENRKQRTHNEDVRRGKQIAEWTRPAAQKEQ